MATLRPWIANDAQQKFINAIAALQMSHGMEIVYAYASYLIPDTVNPATGKQTRGDAGCQVLNAGDPMWCYYTDVNGMQKTYVGMNVGPTGEGAEEPYAYGQTNQYQSTRKSFGWRVCRAPSYNRARPAD